MFTSKPCVQLLFIFVINTAVFLSFWLKNWVRLTVINYSKYDVFIFVQSTQRLLKRIPQDAGPKIVWVRCNTKLFAKINDINCPTRVFKKRTKKTRWSFYPSKGGASTDVIR